MKWLLILTVLFVGCSLDYSQHDPNVAVFKGDTLNIIGNYGDLVTVSNGSYINVYICSNTERTLRVLQSMDYVTIDGSDRVTIDSDISIVLEISGAPSGYRFYISPYLTTTYEVN